MAQAVIKNVSSFITREILFFPPRSRLTHQLRVQRGSICVYTYNAIGSIERTIPAWYKKVLRLLKKEVDKKTKLTNPIEIRPMERVANVRN